MNFGEAIEEVKKGNLVNRKGWNGKNMFIFLRPEDELTADFIIDKVKSLPQSLKNYYVGSFAHTILEKEHGKAPEDTKIKFTAYLCMKTADDTIVNGWLASQIDMLANDWEIFK